MVKESTAEEGISINEIVRRLKMPEKSVRYVLIKLLYFIEEAVIQHTVEFWLKVYDKRLTSVTLL